MNSLLLAFFASCCSSMASLLFRKHGETASSPNSYLTIYWLISFLAAFLFFKVWTQDFNLTALVLGSIVGFLNISLMLSTAKALQKGPAGLTFAFQSASAIFPGFLLFLFFGSGLGFPFSFLQGVGLLLVLFGLFKGAQAGTAKDFKGWLKFALLCFTFQVLALTIFQGRCILFDCSQLPPFWNNFSLTPQDDGWFSLGQFGCATLLQGALLFGERNTIPKQSLLLGFGGGLANFASTFLLLLSTQTATPEYKSLLFPCFCVGGLLICNLWAWKLYKERFNSVSNALCSAGILIGII